MNNIFTPEEENMPVTYGELLKIFEQLKPAIESRDAALDSFSEEILRIYDILVDAEYKRVRDIHFILSYLAQDRLCNRKEFEDVYLKWCEEYDNLNKSQDATEVGHD